MFGESTAACCVCVCLISAEPVSSLTGQTDGSGRKQHLCDLQVKSGESLLAAHSAQFLKSFALNIKEFLFW